MGYYITMDKPPSRIKTIRLPNEPFMQPNGYKPAPLDLSAINLTAKLEELVDQLAENTHNLWAKERIQQGWTYGLNEVSISIHNSFTHKKMKCGGHVCIYPGINVKPFALKL